MKNKIIFVILIIGLIILLYFLKYNVQNKHIDNNKNTNTLIYSEVKPAENKEIVGTISKIQDEYIYIVPEDESFRKTYDEVYFKIENDKKNENENYQEDDIIRISFEAGHISEKGSVEINNIEYLGKARQFNQEITVPVSNSEAPAGSIVFKNFTSNKENIDLSSYIKQDKFYMKKITSYEEYKKYKEIFEELRDLSIDDFVNYYLVITIAEEPNLYYTYSDSEYNNVYLDLFLEKMKNPPLNEDVKYTGLAMIIPNNRDIEENYIRIIYDINEVKISKNQAKKIAIKALKDDNIEEWTDIQIFTDIENMYYLIQKDDRRRDWEHTYDPITKYKWVRIIYVAFQDAGSVGCYVGVSIDATTGEILSYHWSGE